jgi:hypothetical protein
MYTLANNSIYWSMKVAIIALTILTAACAPQVDYNVPGKVGPAGPAGERGSDGSDGANGQSCTVTQMVNGALVSCPDGTTTAILNGTNGVDGQPAPANAYDVVATIDPCGPTSAYDEILLKLANGKILAHFSSGAYQYLTLIGPGNYRTTDASACLFTVNADMTVSW